MSLDNQLKQFAGEIDIVRYHRQDNGEFVKRNGYKSHEVLRSKVVQELNNIGFTVESIGIEDRSACAQVSASETREALFLRHSPDAWASAIIKTGSIPVNGYGCPTERFDLLLEFKTDPNPLRNKMITVDLKAFDIIESFALDFGCKIILICASVDDNLNICSDIYGVDVTKLHEVRANIFVQDERRWSECLKQFKHSNDWVEKFGQPVFGSGSRSGHSYLGIYKSELYVPERTLTSALHTMFNEWKSRFTNQNRLSLI